MFCVVALGSNVDGAIHLSWARERLTALFPDIRFSEEVETIPVNWDYPGMFSNQIACFTTHESPLQVLALFKEIEREAGRTPADKAKGIVRLDIDLLIGDDKVYKPADLQRDYVRKGLAELGISLQ